PSLYEVNADGIFSINALSSQAFEHSVQLGVRNEIKGEMTLSLDNSALDNKWYVYLEDRELGIYVEFKNKPYTYTHTRNADDRFVVHFQQYALNSDKLVEDVKKMKIGGDGNAVYVFVPAYYKDQVYQVEVLDMMGRVVYTNDKTVLNHGMNTLNLNLSNSAYYAVRISAIEGTISEKVYLK